MSKNYYSLGLMSGTSGDGVDASLINSDGETNYKVEINKYFEYENNLIKVFFDKKISGKISRSKRISVLNGKTS